MYLVIDTLNNKIPWVHESYVISCELVYLAECEPCIIFPCEDINEFLKGAVNVPSDGLFEILTDLDGEFESDDSESWWQERCRLATEIMNKISIRKIKVNGFELSSQVLWKDNNGKHKGFVYTPGKYIPVPI